MRELLSSMIALLVAAMLPAIAFALSSPGLGGGLTADAPTLLRLAFLGYVFSLLAVGVLGVPTYLLFRARGLVSLRTSIVAAATLAGVVGVLISLPPRDPWFEWAFSVAAWCLWLCSLGAATGAVFWLVRRALLLPRREHAAP